MSTQPNSNPVILWLTNLVRRPELVTIVAAAVVSGLVFLGVPAVTGEPVPEAAIRNILVALASVVGGAILEGMFKPNYNAGFATLIGAKMKLALAVIVGNVAVAAFATAGLPLCGPDLTTGSGCIQQADIDQVSNLLVSFIWIKAGWDAGKVQVGALIQQAQHRR